MRASSFAFAKRDKKYCCKDRDRRHEQNENRQIQILCECPSYRTAAHRALSEYRIRHQRNQQDREHQYGDVNDALRFHRTIRSVLLLSPAKVALPDDRASLILVPALKRWALEKLRGLVALTSSTLDPVVARCADHRLLSVTLGVNTVFCPLLNDSHLPVRRLEAAPLGRVSGNCRGRRRATDKCKSLPPAQWSE